MVFEPTVLRSPVRIPPSCPTLGSGSRRFSAVIAAGLLALGVIGNGWAKPIELVKSRLYVNYSSKPDPQDLTTFDLCILDPGAEADLKPGHTLGHTFLAYISTVEVRAGSPMEKAALKRKLPTAGSNAAWGTQLLDITAPGWMQMIVDDLARDAVAKGFDGFFLDTLDSAELLTKQSPEKAAAHRAALVGLIKELRAKHPDAKIVLNRGFGLVEEVAADINGVLVESVLQTFDPKTKRYDAVTADGTAWLERRIRSIQMLRLPVYAVDYVQPDQKDLAEETAKKLTALGCIPFVTTHDLDGTILAPVCEVPRRILVLYGHDPKFADKVTAPAGDTQTARHLQSALGWLGYQTEYLDVGAHPLPDPLPARFGGVVIEGTISLEAGQEKFLERWLERQKERGTPILFAGGIPFSDEDARTRLASAFGLSGSLLPTRGVRSPSITKFDGAMMNAASPLAARAYRFTEVTAPPSSDVVLSLLAEDPEGRPVRFDPIFLTSWGGAWFEPYVAFQSASGEEAAHLDPFPFLAKWLRPMALFPVPDDTTRDGRRVLSIHVSAEGFSKPTSFPGHPICAEAVRAHLFKHYPLPATVSFAMPGNTAAQATAPEDTQIRDSIARSILAMPNIEQAGPLRSPTHLHPLPGMIGTFVRTETPLRTEAVYLPYDMGIAADPVAMRGLEKIYDWCATQPLHPVSALEQALITRDAARTKCFTLGTNHWLISNGGNLRTFRVPASAGVPDMARCRGVSGYKAERGITYIHTTGRAQTELVLVEPAAAMPEQLRLVESGADITFHALTSHNAVFQVGGWSSVDVIFAGMPPGAMIDVRKNKEPGRLQADATGSLKLSLPARSTVTLNVPPTAYAASR